MISITLEFVLSTLKSIKSITFILKFLFLISLTNILGHWLT